jgi:hypothetical protein
MPCRLEDRPKARWFPDQGRKLQESKPSAQPFPLLTGGHVTMLYADKLWARIQACQREPFISPGGLPIVRKLGWVVGNVHYQRDRKRTLLGICFGKVKSDARSGQLIALTRFLGEALSIEYRHLPVAARNQTGTFQLPGSIRDGWPLNAQHFGEKVLSDQQHVLVTAVTHHEQPTRQPLLEAVRTVARHRHHYLLLEGLNVSGHEISEGRHRLHRLREGRARHLGSAPRDLDQKSDGGKLGAEKGLHTRATLSTDRCHLNDAAVGINRDHRDDTAIGEKDMVERTIGVHEHLLTSAANVFELWHELFEIAGGKVEQKPIARPS